MAKPKALFVTHFVLVNKVKDKINTILILKVISNKLKLNFQHFDNVCTKAA